MSDPARARDLLVKLEVKRLTTLAAQRRLERQRRAIDRALTRLRLGDDVPLVLRQLWLDAGVTVTGAGADEPSPESAGDLRQGERP